MSRNSEELFKNRLCKAILVVGMAFFMQFPVQGQSYQTAGGLRLSYGGLLSVKHALNDHNYLEGTVSLRWNGVVVTALYEWQEETNSENLQWFAGAGIHAGVHGRNNVFQPDNNDNNVVQVGLGMDLIGGIEYIFEGVPIVISADYKPAFYFTGERWFIPEEFGLTARYIIAH